MSFSVQLFSPFSLFRFLFSKISKLFCFQRQQFERNRRTTHVILSSVVTDNRFIGGCLDHVNIWSRTYGFGPLTSS